MYNNKQKQVIVAGNDFKIKFSLKKFDDGSYIPFDLSTCTDLHVLLISSQEIDLKYEILQDKTDTILATVDYRLVKPNTAYGFAVEGNDSDGNHFRWEMRPSEGIFVVANTSSMHITQDTYTLDIEGRVGWGYDGYTKAEIDDKFTVVDNDIDRIDLSIQGIDGDIAELDNLVDGLTGDIADLQNTVQGLTGNVEQLQQEMTGKQDLLISSQNIKTINHQSILGSGNIEIQGGSGVEQVQTDWNQTNTQAVDYIKNKPDLSTKQDTLVSGVNIKTINNEDILGSGNISIQAPAQEQADWNQTDIQAVDYIKNKPNIDEIRKDLDTLSESTIKQVNDIIEANEELANSVENTSSELAEDMDFINPQFKVITESLNDLNNEKQATLVSTQNIKTINGESILGSGNIVIQGGSGSVQQIQVDWNQTDVQAVDYIKNKPDLSTKQDVLTQGANIEIINNIISATGLATVQAVQTLAQDVQAIPRDICCTQTDATFVGKDNTDLFYLRQANSQLAGLMTATDKIKLNDLPTGASITASLASKQDKNIPYTEQFTIVGSGLFPGLGNVLETTTSEIYQLTTDTYLHNGDIITADINQTFEIWYDDETFVAGNTVTRVFREETANIYTYTCEADGYYAFAIPSTINSITLSKTTTVATTQDVQGVYTYADTLDSTSVKSSMTGLQIEIVAQMPASPAQNTIYIVQ